MGGSECFEVMQQRQRCDQNFKQYEVLLIKI